MSVISAFALLAAEGDKPIDDLTPKPQELIIGAIAFAIVFFFIWKWVIPQVNRVLEQRQQKIQGDLEKAEQARVEAEGELVNYRSQLAGAREEANRIIEEARKTADSLRNDMTIRAEHEYQAIVARAQEEIRAERDRVFQELKAQVSELSVALAGRVVGESLDKTRHMRLVDDYIKELGKLGSNGSEG